MKWLFMFCILNGVECDRQIENLPTYDDCIVAMEQYVAEHEGEEFWAVCKWDEEIRA